MVDEVKKRKIRKDDWDSLAKYVTEALTSRQNDGFRKDHERIWKEVDRQIAMKPMQIVPKTEKPQEADWRNVLELGDLTKAKEIIEADVMRITFPQERRWFDAHCELGKEFEETGPQKVDPTLQKMADNVYRSFISQQHGDFGFQDRFKLSIGEALAHGSFVAEIEWETQMMVDSGSKIKTVGAPVWKPHSMWNCYPDPAPSIVGSNMFYAGSMILVSYMDPQKLKSMSGPGWMPGQYKQLDDKKGEQQVEGRKTKDIKLVKYYGDLTIERGGEDIYLPNSKIIVANDKVVVFFQPNELPYPSVIYGGYHKQDVRDPYYTSPLIKMSPMQKMGSKLASRFLDGIDLMTEKPLEYDANDPQYAMNGGPDIAPGSRSGTKYGGKTNLLEVGEPEYALKGLEWVNQCMQEGLGISAPRSGAPTSDRATAYEVSKVAQGGEVRTVEFIRQIVPCLRTWLYMQHALNEKHLDKYSFYNDELNTQDFVRIKRSDLPDAVHFDVVGAKGLLGEEQRINRTTAVTGFAAGSPIFAPLLKPAELLLEMYRDAGQKSPERFVNAGDGESPPDPRLMEAQQMIQELQQELMKEKQNTEVKMGELQLKAKAQEEETAMKLKELQAEIELKWAEFRADMLIKGQELRANAALERERHKVEAQKPQKKSRSLKYDEEGKVTQIDEIVG